MTKSHPQLRLNLNRNKKVTAFRKRCSVSFWREAWATVDQSSEDRTVHANNFGFFDTEVKPSEGPANVRLTSPQLAEPHARLLVRGFV